MKELNLTDEQALLRGIEHASDDEVEALFRAFSAMRQPCRYSNENVDRLMHAHAALRDIRRAGRTPLETHAEMTARFARERAADGEDEPAFAGAGQ